MYGNWFSTAANMVSGDNPAYTAEDFLADFPQFMSTDLTPVCLVPEAMLTVFIRMANEAIQQARWFEAWRYGMGLYIAHYATLYLRSYRAGSTSAGEAASTGDRQGLLTAQSAVDVSESYSYVELVESTKAWGSLNATEYGQQLASLGRIYGMGPAFFS